MATRPTTNRHHGHRRLTQRKPNRRTAGDLRTAGRTRTHAPAKLSTHHHSKSTKSRRRLFSRLSDSARIICTRVDGSSQSWVRCLPAVRLSAGVTRLVPRTFFAPQCTAPNKRAPWLTRLSAAPKKKEQQKMSLGDFLGDQCTPPVLPAAPFKTLTHGQRWDRGPTRWRMRPCLVSRTHSTLHVPLLTTTGGAGNDTPLRDSSAAPLASLANGRRRVLTHA